MSFPGPLANACLFRVATASGKTTLLDSIASLWQFWGEWIDVGDGKAPPKYQLKHYLASARFVAMEVHEIAPTMRPLWICISGPLGWSRLRNAYPDHAFAGLEHVGHSWSLILTSESNLDLKTLRNQALLGTRPVWSSREGPSKSPLPGPRSSNLLRFRMSFISLGEPHDSAAKAAPRRIT